MRSVLLKLVLLVIAAGLVALGAIRWGRVHVVATVQGELMAPPAGDGRWVAWLEGDPGETRLLVMPRHGSRPAVSLRAAALSGLAVDGDAAYLTRSAPEGKGRTRAELLRIRLPQGTPKAIGALTRGASQMVSGDGWLCWREDYEAALPGVPFVVAAAPVTVVRARRESAGDAEVVATVSGPDAGPGPHGLALLGVTGGSAYWVERMRVAGSTATVVRRARLPGGEAENLVQEEGERSAALGKGTLLWTAPSAEAAEPYTFSAVKQRRLDASEVSVIADWLGPVATVMVTRGRVYVQDRHLLWALGGERGQQRVIYRGAGWASAAPVLGDEQYLVLPSRAGTQIARRPLTAWARLASLWR